MRILVVRNDRLGDFMLAWPAFATLRQYCPDALICALVPQYTVDMANLCPWIDEVLVDEGEGIISLARKLAQYDFDALITLYSTTRVAWAGYLAHIPYRLAPATKVAQFLYNNRLVQHRSRSEKPEYAYNIDIVYRFLQDRKVIFAETISPDDYLPASIKRPLLAFPTTDSTQLRTQFCKQHNIHTGAELVFIHPGSGGSANNLTKEQYSELANGLNSPTPLAIILTAGPGEEQSANQIAARITTHPAIVLLPEGGLLRLAQHLQLADLFISCSTGPLHIAGALNRLTAAFYPRHRSGSPLRWQTLNSPEKRLVFVPPNDAEATQVSDINIFHAIQKINAQLNIYQKVLCD